jgi:dUTP pyrophosphatase
MDVYPRAMDIDVKLLDPRLEDWGFPAYGSALAAGLDLFACLEAPLLLEPQAPAQLISSGIALHIADPEWCALIYPRSGAGHRNGLVLGNSVGVIDADYQGPCLVSAWNRTPPGGRAIEIQPGERIAQLVLTRIARPRFRIVKAFATTTRREAGGFGSTGT